MTIKYFRPNEFGEIFCYEIDTTDREYVSHSDDIVSINEGYGRPTEYSRRFEVVKKRLVDMLMKRLLDVQEMEEKDVDFL
jgi:hypothetical protein